MHFLPFSVAVERCVTVILPPFLSFNRAFEIVTNRKWTLVGREWGRKSADPEWSIARSAHGIERGPVPVYYTILCGETNVAIHNACLACPQNVD